MLATKKENEDDKERFGLDVNSDKNSDSDEKEFNKDNQREILFNRRKDEEMQADKDNDRSFNPMDLRQKVPDDSLRFAESLDIGSGIKVR